MGIMVDADFVFHGGKVITIDEKKPRAQGVAVKDGKIFWVGTDDEVRQAIGKGTRVWDLKGMTVVPGFIESHNHTLMFGLGLSAIDLTKAGSIEEILALVRERAGRQEEGTWITGVGYNQNELREKRHPTCQDLDRAAPKHFVSLRHTSAHALVVNNLALTKAGITKDSPDPAGGKIGRDVGDGGLDRAALRISGHEIGGRPYAQARDGRPGHGFGARQREVSGRGDHQRHGSRRRD